MASRKETNKYYPPDYDPSMGSLNAAQGIHPLRGRARKIGDGILTIRFAMPFECRCTVCQMRFSRAERFNVEKSPYGVYLSIPRFKFTMPCPKCRSPLVFATDPQRRSYECVENIEVISKEMEITQDLIDDNDDMRYEMIGDNHFAHSALDALYLHKLLHDEHPAGTPVYSSSGTNPSNGDGTQHTSSQSGLGSSEPIHSDVVAEIVGQHKRLIETDTLYKLEAQRLAEARIQRRRQAMEDAYNRNVAHHKPQPVGLGGRYLWLETDSSHRLALSGGSDHAHPTKHEVLSRSAANMGDGGASISSSSSATNQHKGETSSPSRIYLTSDDRIKRIRQATRALRQEEQATIQSRKQQVEDEEDTHYEREFLTRVQMRQPPIDHHIHSERDQHNQERPLQPSIPPMTPAIEEPTPVSSEAYTNDDFLRDERFWRLRRARNRFLPPINRGYNDTSKQVSSQSLAQIPRVKAKKEQKSTRTNHSNNILLESNSDDERSSSDVQILSMSSDLGSSDDDIVVLDDDSDLVIIENDDHGDFIVPYDSDESDR